MNDPGNLTYSEAVAAGLYGPQDQADATGGVCTDSPHGEPVPPHFGATQTGPVIRQAMRN